MAHSNNILYISRMDLEIAIPKPIRQTFAYRASDAIAPGTRVVVPFGPAELVGVVLGPAVGLDEKLRQRLRPITRVVDSSPVFSKTLLELAAWISTYYIHPLGDVLRCMLPASIEKTSGAYFSLTEAGREALLDESVDSKLLATLFGKKARLTPRQFNSRMAQASQKTGFAADPEQWQADGLVAFWDGSPTPRTSHAGGVVPEMTQSTNPSPHILTKAQLEVFETICTTSIDKKPERPFLLHGVTGSGKTEIFLRVIEYLFASDKVQSQALVLVPEISLTPQITNIFVGRFPGVVAVVHSAMPDEQRWQEMERIRAGTARILIGPRSAVFAPFLNLGLVIVDEEHDSSYKQSSGLRYNGRDVAILRAQMERASIILASATPSLESTYNAGTGKYTLLSLPERANGQPLPTIELLPSNNGWVGAKVGSPHSPANTQSQAAAISPTIIAELKANLALGRQAMVIVNRRGYSYFLYCAEQRQPVVCANCSISLTVHARNTVLRCHYCNYATLVAQLVAKHPERSYFVVGYGTEQAAEILSNMLPEARIARLDSDTISRRGILESTLGKFRTGDIDILVGTQILAKGHDFPNVTLIVILEVDQTLSLPDFRAGERAFQLMVQAAGRAGRAELPGKVIIQTRRPAHPVIQAGLTHDFHGFSRWELGFRRNFNYPPFSRMIVLEYSAQYPVTLELFSKLLESTLANFIETRPEQMSQIQIMGPATPPLEVVRRRHRRTLVFTSTNAKLQKALVQDLITLCPTPKAIRMIIDVDPQSLI